ncbi:helix-turn-helix transcriptional regulator [Actinoplanes sp. CA-015351]|uniref:helix-turn-helix transcriptional regulator n=1 Tax=Actinoplanes sp. CA-015351 TaxID=3239897 RepID=UPI003D978707
MVSTAGRQLTGTRGVVDRLSPGCQQLLRVAAVAGPVVAIDEVAEVLLTSVAALLPTIDEAIGSGLLVVRDCSLVFADPGLRRRLLAGIPGPVLGPLRAEIRRGELRAGITEQHADDDDPDPALLSVREWDRGDVSSALCRSRRASEDPQTPARQRGHARMVLTYQLIATDEPDTAAELIRQVEPEAGQAVPAALRARLALRQGRTDAARAEAEAAIRDGDPLGTPLARAVLAVTALRAGDPAGARRHAVLGRSALTEEPALPTTFLDWVELLVTMDGRDTEAAGPAATALAGRAVLYLEEPGAAPWLTRLALGAGDHELVAAVSAGLDSAVDQCPAGRTAVALRAAAAHVRALAAADAQALRRVPENQPDPWAAALAAEDHGTVLLRDGDPGDQAAAVHSLQTALSAFTAIGAQRESARVRSTLRRVGVRRRDPGNGAARREGSGWAGLTDMERTIAHLVGRGLTNQQASRQVSLSPHTVNYHLRQIFRKLGVRSRVEIARLMPRDV